MALDIKVLLQQVWKVPRVLRVIAVIAFVDVLIILYTLLSLSDDVDDRAAQADQLKAQLVKQQEKVIATRKEIAQLPELRKLYDTALASGLLADQDRLKFINLAQDLAKTDQLSDFHFKLSPKIRVAITGTKYHLVSTDVSLTNTALRDGDVFSFWDEVLNKSQAHYHLTKATIERVGDVTSVVAGIKAGTQAVLVKAELSFQWRSMRAPAGCQRRGQTAGATGERCGRRAGRATP